MRSNKFAIATIAFTAVLALPGVSQATSLYHPASNEAGVTVYPDHAKNGKSRAEVLAELDAARKDGSYAQLQRGTPVPVKSVGPGKTRQQVIDELLGESPEERLARLR